MLLIIIIPTAIMFLLYILPELKMEFAHKLVIGMLTVPAMFLTANYLAHTSHSAATTSWEKKYDIISLERGSGTSGSFLLGFGSINTKQAYFMYMPHGNDLFKLEHEYAYKTFIKETNKEKPSVKVLKCYKPIWASLLAPGGCRGEQINIIVPKNTITRTFNP